MGKKTKKSYVNRSLYFILLGTAGIGLFLFIWLIDEAHARVLAAEDGVIETITALLYIIGFGVCLFRIIRKTSSYKTWLVFWGLLCFFCFGEEMSWLQRQLNYGIPSFLEGMSAQEELNIHNLNIFQGGHWIDAFRSGKFDLKMFLGSQNLFRFGFFVYFLVVPLIIYAGKLKFIREKLNYPLPGVFFLSSIWVILFVSFLLASQSSGSTKAALAETREMFYALFITLYIYIYLRSKDWLSKKTKEI